MSFSPSAVSQAIAAQFGGCQEFSGSDDTPLHTAAYEGNVAALRESLKKRASREAIDQRNHLGCTPLRLAATGGHGECVSLLLDHGCSIDIPDVKGQTPLHVAVKNMHCKCAELLLERGADPNGHAHNRTTPLGIAAMQGSLDLVQLLLDFNAETGMRRQSAYGLYFTVDPLQLAAAYQHYDCLKALLAAGAQVVSFSSFTGVFSPYHTLVRQSCGRRFAELLYEFGSTPWAKDAKGHFPWEMEPRGGGQDSESYQELMEFFNKVRAEPRPLKSCCRLSVWRQMVCLKKNASALKHLPNVPQSIIQYLTFQQL